MRVVLRNRDGALARFFIYGLLYLSFVSQFAPELGRFFSREITIALFVGWLAVFATALWFDDRVFSGKGILLIWGMFAAYGACLIDSGSGGRGNELMAGAIASGIVGLVIVFPVRASIQFIEGKFRRCVTPGQCDRCDYPLYGLTSDRCPECGEEIAQLPGGNAVDPRDIPPL